MTRHTGVHRTRYILRHYYVRPEQRSHGLDRLQCCWHVRYQFCGLLAEITVNAEDEAEARGRQWINFACAA